jgi:hypothetical protein
LNGEIIHFQNVSGTVVSNGDNVVIPDISKRTAQRT